MRNIILKMLDEIRLFYPNKMEVDKWKLYVLENLHDSDTIPTAIHKLHIGCNRNLKYGRLDKKVFFIIRKNILNKS